MSKTKNDIPAIEAGKPITIEAESRQDATEQLNAMRKQAEGDGLTQTEGGFIEYQRTAEGEDKFSAVITFNKL
jgi:hypothetical protein